MLFDAYNIISIFPPCNILPSLESDDTDWANAVPGAKEFWERIPSERGTGGKVETVCHWLLFPAYKILKYFLECKFKRSIYYKTNG